MRRLRFADLDAVASRGFHLAPTRLRRGEETYLHDHDFPEVFLVVAGTGWHRCHGAEAALAPGDLVWVAAADAHGYRDGGRRPLEFLNLALDPAWWRRFCAVAGDGRDLLPALRGGGPVPRSAAVAEPRRLERELRGLMAGGAPGGAALVAVVARLVAATGRTGPAAPAETPAGRPPPAWLARLRAELAAPGAALRPLAHWQRRSGRSPEHFARACRQHFGTTPTELVRRARIERAQALLLAPDAKVAAVALESGFENLGYFYRTFRRLAGCTPGAWLARHAAAAVPRGPGG
jgi:AraC family cel operon transcriptional repressor